jgi:hypothetical protein
MADEDRAAEVEQRMEESRERLELTDEQAEQIAPILEESTAARRDILSKYGIDLERRSARAQRLGLSEGGALKQELDVVRKDTLSAVADILTEQQLEEFKRMQKETQAQVRRRIREHR